MAEDATAVSRKSALPHVGSGLQCGDGGGCQCQPSAAEAREFRKASACCGHSQAITAL